MRGQRPPLTPEQQRLRDWEVAGIEIAQQVGDTIRERREEALVSQRELARLFGVRQSEISALERPYLRNGGKSYYGLTSSHRVSDLLIRICRVMQIDLTKVIEYSQGASK